MGITKVSLQELKDYAENHVEHFTVNEKGEATMLPEYADIFGRVDAGEDMNMFKQKYMAEGSDRDFDNPMDAVKEASYQSQQNGGKEKAVIRCVMYTGDTEWRKYTMSKVALPPEADITITDGEQPNPTTVLSGKSTHEVGLSRDEY